MGKFLEFFVYLLPFKGMIRLKMELWAVLQDLGNVLHFIVILCQCHPQSQILEENSVVQAII